jgi:uncharacterized membrane protein
MNDSPTKSAQGTLSAYGITQTLLNLLFLTLSLLRPSEPGRALFLGLSWQRLAVSLVLLLATLGAFAMLILVLRRHDSVSALAERLQGNLHLPALGLALLLMLSGAALLIPDALGAADAMADYLDRLQPLAGWLFLSGCALAVTIQALTQTVRTLEALAFFLVVSICLLGMLAHVRLWPKSEDRNDDIYFTFLEGDRLLSGVNPYARVLEGDMQENEKYATYLPLFYYLSAGVQRLGLVEYPQWLAFWRLVFLLACSWIAICIFLRAWATRLKVFAVAASLFWLFNRWTLHVSISADLDFLPLALLLTSWALIGKRPRAALVVFGTSIAIKHYSVFLAPLILMSIWRTSPDPKARIWKDLLLLGSVPLIASLPFLFLDAEAFVKSILFSVSRNPMATGDIYSLDALLGWSGWAARIPMIGLLGLIYVAVWRGRLGAYASSLLVLATVTFFNSVFFTSYMVWVVPFVPLACLEAFPRAHETHEAPGKIPHGDRA